jgi:acetate kinase
MNTILVVNAGSSSVKFQLYEANDPSRLARLVKGSIDGVGTQPRLRGEDAYGKALVDRSFDAKEIADIPAAMQVAAGWLREAQNLEPTAVGHRVVHGGPDYDRPMLIDDAVLAELECYAPLAPLHQPNNLAPIGAIRARFPRLPQVACFDTAFHRGHGPIVDHFAIPERFYAEGVRRGGRRELGDDPRAYCRETRLAGSGAGRCSQCRGQNDDLDAEEPRRPLRGADR